MLNASIDIDTLNRDIFWEEYYFLEFNVRYFCLIKPTKIRILNQNCYLHIKDCYPRISELIKISYCEKITDQRIFLNLLSLELCVNCISCKLFQSKLRLYASLTILILKLIQTTWFDFEELAWILKTKI